MKRIVLISTGQPTLNPRLIKEADTLSKQGFEVIVLYQHWSEWAIKTDKELLKEKNWLSKIIGGNPEVNKLCFLITRILFKWHKYLSQIIGLKFGLAELSLARCTWLLKFKARKIKADLYIAHNLGALPAAVFAAKYHKAKSGFDAEDFHRFETSDDKTNINVKRNKFIEEKYVPEVDYLTAASPQIALAYRQIFNREIYPVLNVFELNTYKLYETKNQEIKLLWFSQTIGPNRGIETIIEALNLSKNKFSLYLLGEIETSYRLKLELMMNSLSVVHFTNPVGPDQLLKLASTFDIGLALETGVPYNRNICLTNKIFTYIQSGLATIATNTLAQKELLNKYPDIGFIFNQADAGQLMNILDSYHQNRSLLTNHKNNAYYLGQTELNWEIESQKFLNIIHQTLSS